MKSFQSGNHEVSPKVIAIAVASTTLGIGIITLPRTLAEATSAGDGLLSIFIAGIVICIFAAIAAKLASRFPRQTFIQYVSQVVPKPFANVITFLVGIYALINVAFIVRSVGNISKMYLFATTPIEVIMLFFLLVVIYAVFGKRIAILRLNMMFFPIILTVVMVIGVMNFRFIDAERLRPFLMSDWQGILTGAKSALFSFLGFEIVLIYVMYMKKPKQAAKASVFGVFLVTFLYLFIYFFSIVVFGNEVIRTFVYPTIELARHVDIPGGFFERFESIFFTIWVMTLFNTATMSYDIALLTFRSVFKKGKKIVYLSILSPLIILLARVPATHVDLAKLSAIFSLYGCFIAMIVPSILFLIAKARGVRADK
ncbi:hypothetical protein BEP19_15205 [Ammoniphilus oxalaticus]|uniref:Uncharacterized protein n=1 Tax=Ammoniphilus oxalaticus TaxID=66863 RepID=A0A419SD51_9BACL|nr:endospore germination permease [Ammoniphilus oxalaticus]RKD21026.1 hypothetical protein BEP19_15205 [Ammoniphilus oxalaticus]